MVEDQKRNFNRFLIGQKSYPLYAMLSKIFQTLHCLWATIIRSKSTGSIGWHIVVWWIKHEYIIFNVSIKVNIVIINITALAFSRLVISPNSSTKKDRVDKSAVRRICENSSRSMYDTVDEGSIFRGFPYYIADRRTINLKKFP